MIAIVGLGFVGLTTALGFCEKGFSVIGYDNNTNKMNDLNNCLIPFYEPYLEEACQRHSGNKFYLADSMEELVKKSKVIFYCVGTPSKDDGSADLTYIYDAINSSLQLIKKDKYKLFVIKSTVPPTTAQDKIKPFVENHGFAVGKDVGIANNPEFLREGSAWNDFIKPDRIVIGAEDNKSFEILNNIYERFDAPVHHVSLNTSEFIKYLSNTLLASLVSFSNEMMMIGKCMKGIDIKKSFEVLHEDKRWFGWPAGIASYVYPGCGYGGYCLPKDTIALYNAASKSGFDAVIIKHVIDTNLKIVDFVVDQITNGLNSNLAIGILGLSFKPNSDDVRHTPAKFIIEKLIEREFKNIIAYDPMAMENFMQEFPNIKINFANSVEELAKEVDIIILVTAWEEFVEKKDILIEKQVIDLRYCL